MKCFAIILMLACVAFAEKIRKPGKECESLNEGKLKMFNRQAYYMAFPCKYFALKGQVCGKWNITLTPGLRWLGKRYYLDTIWASVEHTTEKKKWEARITNKLAVKYYNDKNAREMFNQKNLDDGNKITTAELLKTDVGKKEVYAEERANKDFIFTFYPWDPHTGGFQHARFKFECLAANQSDVPYPDQMCGDQEKEAVFNRAKDDFNLESRFDILVIYYDLFMNEDVVQTNEKCIDAGKIFRDNCTSPAQRMDALRQCHQILSSEKHTECVTKYSCDPMDVFNACLRWVCGGYTNKLDCEVVGESIDSCPKFASSGGLSDLVDTANCYKDFLPLEKISKA